MKTKLLLCILTTALAVHASSALSLEPSIGIVNQSDITFDYPHKVYGILPGIIKADRGRYIGLRAGNKIGVDIRYIDISLDQVTVGGQLKNWGDSAQGYSIGIDYRQPITKHFYTAIGAGYQDILGGALYGQAEVGIKKKSISISVSRRYVGSSTYEDLTMSKSEQTFIGIKFNKKF